MVILLPELSMNGCTLSCFSWAKHHVTLGKPLLLPEQASLELVLSCLH